MTSFAVIISAAVWAAASHVIDSNMDKRRLTLSSGDEL